MIVQQKFTQALMMMNDNEFFFFSDIASACRKGKCYLCGDINSLKFLSKKLEQPAKNIYNALINRYAESKSIMELVNKVFVLTMNIDLSHNQLPNVLKQENKTQILLIENVMKWNISEPCCLIAENLEDCDFYTLIAQIQNSQGININFHKENGGGSTTSEVLCKCVTQDKIPTLCIIDSDKTYGSGKSFSPSKGVTLKKVMDTGKNIRLNECNNPPYCIFPLEVHEVENLIPLCILEELKTQYPAMTDGLNILLKLKNIQNGTPILYYDMKKGFSYIKEENKRIYWEEILINLGGTKSDMPPTTEKKAPESKPFFPPLICNAGLLKQTNNLLRNNKLPKNFQIDKYLIPHWKNIKDIILTWGCVSIPMYS